MRYAAPVAMPVGLGEWLGAELEARGVEAASLYARAVLSILLHSEADTDLDRDQSDLDPNQTWNPRAALELELRLERQNKETRRGRPLRKNNISKSNNHHHKGQGNQRSNNTSTYKMANNQTTGTLRRRPHSWNGDGEELKKCAAVECLLSATDDDQWPVEKLVDELCARLKLLQMEGNSMQKKQWGLGSSAPECFDGPSSDSDSFTSVSSPEIDQENYYQDFPPLEHLSDSDKKTEPPQETVWNVRRKTKVSPEIKPRVPFVRMTGTRLSPPPPRDLPPSSGHTHSCGDASEAYFGDCSRDSSLERAPTPSITLTNPESGTVNCKGRLYERGQDCGVDIFAYDLNAALKRLEQIVEDQKQFSVPKVDLEHDQNFLINCLDEGGKEAEVSEWKDWSLQSSLSNIWAPIGSDWGLGNTESHWPKCQTKDCNEEKSTNAVQQSLALLNHNPNSSGFATVIPEKGSCKGSKLIGWVTGVEQSGIGEEEAEKEVEDLLHDSEHEDEEENLLTSPKTHFCPIQQEGETEVQVSDGSTFVLDAHPEEVHFLRSPSGTLYLPESEENGDGWKGWTKYMVYKTPTSPSPIQESESPSRPASPFTLKFRVVQTEKCCQTDPTLEQENGLDNSTHPLGLSSPFVSSFPVTSGLLGDGDVWKFDAEAVNKEKVDGIKSEDEEEEDDGLLKEVWNVTALQEPVIETKAEEECSVKELPVEAESVWLPEEGIELLELKKEEEFDLDELWNPLMSDFGEEQDICEWIPQQNYEEDEGMWGEGQWAESWPPPNIPIEYLDDEFFEEMYGSLDSKTSESVGGGGGSKSNRRHCRRRRRNSHKQPPAQRRRPCSFFVEGECRRPDCKFSHDLGSIPCRFWLEFSCFKGDACPFLHGHPVKERERNQHRSYPQSDVELSEGCASEDTEPQNKKKTTKFQLDLETDFPSLSQALDFKPRMTSRPRPIPTTSGFAAADNTGSSLENGSNEGGGVKRRRRRFPCQRFKPVTVVTTSSESSPGEVTSVNIAGKKSRKVAKVTVTTSIGGCKPPKKEKCRAADMPSERRRAKSEHVDSAFNGVSTTRLRLSSSYKEG